MGRRTYVVVESIVHADVGIPLEHKESVGETLHEAAVMTHHQKHALVAAQKLLHHLHTCRRHGHHCHHTRCTQTEPWDYIWNLYYQTSTAFRSLLRCATYLDRFSLMTIHKAGTIDPFVMIL